MKKGCYAGVEELNEKLTDANNEAATIKNEIIQVTNMIKYFENLGSGSESIGSYISKMEREYNAALS